MKWGESVAMAMQYLFSRDIDKLGRYVIAKEIRDEWGVTEDDRSVAAYVDGAMLILMKKQPQDVCVICGLSEELYESGPAMICKKCIQTAVSNMEQE